MMSKLYRVYFKRLLDFSIALFGLICLSPLFLMISLAIKITSSGRIFFQQERMGINFQPFKIYKFRTMVENAAKLGPSVTSRDDPRITPVGRFLRKTKLDELPQLINVIKGDMSLVGPRPEVEKFVDAARMEYETVLSVRPGITDYAAIEYRDEEVIMQKYENKEKAYINKILPVKISLYKQYIYDMGLFVDLKVIFSTLLKIMPFDLSLNLLNTNINTNIQPEPALASSAPEAYQQLARFLIDPKTLLPMNPVFKYPEGASDFFNFAGNGLNEDRVMEGDFFSPSTGRSSLGSKAMELEL